MYILGARALVLCNKLPKFQRPSKTERISTLVNARNDSRGMNFDRFGIQPFPLPRIEYSLSRLPSARFSVAPGYCRKLKKKEKKRKTIQLSRCLHVSRNRAIDSKIRPAAVAARNRIFRRRCVQQIVHFNDARVRRR